MLIFYILNQLIEIYIWMILADVVVSWLVGFGIINPYHRWVSPLLQILHIFTTPPLRFIRRFVPPIAQLDISPLILILCLYVLKTLLYELQIGFY